VDDWTDDELDDEVVVEAAAAVDDEVPATVWALTTPKAPTPARAANATPAVRRFRSRMAESRTLIRESVPLASCSMAATLVDAAGTSLGDSCEIAVRPGGEEVAQGAL
jgi:hypothetical protein